MSNVCVEERERGKNGKISVRQFLTEDFVHLMALEDNFTTDFVGFMSLNRLLEFFVS